MLSLRLGRTYKRLDWWKIKDEHTPFQWALQYTAESVRPSGEDRDDLRQAWIAANLLRAQMAEKLNEEEFKELVIHLCQYMKDNSDSEDEIGLAALEIMKRKGA
jgi:hypothetical protein